MDEFVDSTGDLGDRDRLLRRLSEDGCLFFRRLLPRDEVLRVRELTLQALDDVGWLDGSEPPANAKPGPKVVSEGDEDFFDGYRLIQAAEGFHALAHDETVRALIGRLVDGEVLVHPRKIARIAFPDNPRGTTPPHQDYRYIQGTTDVFTCWTPLGACPPELGGLRVLRGSHERGLLPTRWNDGRAAGLEVDTEDGDPGWATAAYEPGDAIIFHSLTVHGAIPNEAGAIRISADYRYQSAADPLVADSLKPHYYPRVPDWPELVSDWRSMAPISVPPDLDIVGFGPPLDLANLEPSRFFEFAGQSRPHR